jgi:nucleotide-binding universal stress UspA family protein
MGATMTRVLAMLDDSPQAPDVLATATTLARMLQCDLDAVTVVLEQIDRTSSEGPARAERRDDTVRTMLGVPEDVLPEELAKPDVLVGVLGTRTLRSHPQLLGHLACALVTATSTPLVLVPPGTRPLMAEHPVFLVPLDGDQRTSDSVGALTALLSPDGGEHITLHVFDSTSVPMFTPSRHGTQIIADEFAALHASGTSWRAEARIGSPAQHILEVARQHDVDAIVLAWNQNLGPGRAETLRRVIGETDVPVILAPCRRQAPTRPPSRPTTPAEASD